MSAQTLSPVLPSPSFTPPAPLSPFPSSASQAADDYTDLENLNSLFLHLDASLKSKKKEVDGKVEELRGMRALDTLSDANTSRIDLDLDRLTGEKGEREREREREREFPNPNRPLRRCFERCYNSDKTARRKRLHRGRHKKGETNWHCKAGVRGG